MERVLISATDRILIDRIVTPIALRIPRSVKPNTVTLLTPLCATASFLAAASAPSFEGFTSLSLRVAAALLMLGSMLTDHLDGMHARRTGQTSRFGEVLDHWLDTLHVPLATAGLALTLEADPWAVWTLIATNAMIYNAQLVLYHHTKKFVYAPLGGASGQVTLAFGYVLIGVVYFFLPTLTTELSWLVPVTCLGVALVQLRQVVFYLGHLRRRVVNHGYFILLSAAAGVLYGVGFVSTTACVLLLVAISVRVTGTYVLRTMLREPYSGFDLGATLSLVALAAIGLWLPRTELGSFTLLELATYTIGALLLAADILEFLRTGALLRAEESSGAATSLGALDR